MKNVYAIKYKAKESPNATIRKILTPIGHSIENDTNVAAIKIKIITIKGLRAVDFDANAVACLNNN